MPVLLAAPAAAAPAPVRVEGEVMRLTAGRAQVVAEPTASAARSRVLSGRSAVSAVVRTDVVAGRLVLRVRRDSTVGVPRAVVVVDGRPVDAFDVTSTTWTERVVRGRWAAGRHHLVVRSTRPTGGAHLRLDRVVLAGPSAGRPAGPTAGPSAPTAAPAAVRPAGPAAAAAGDVDDAYEAEVVRLVNAERASRGLSPLRVSPCVDGYAESWVSRLLSLRTLVHRTDLGSVMQACGGRGVAENIAYGSVTPQRLVQMWMGSAGHRANILGRYTHVGTGAVRASDGTVYAAQNFLSAP